MLRLKKRANDSQAAHDRLLKRQDEESSKIASLKVKYKEILEELVGNNKWYKRRNEELQNENAKLKKENADLLESLMA